MSESALIDDSILAEIRPRRENEERSPQGPGELLTHLLRMVRDREPRGLLPVSNATAHPAPRLSGYELQTRVAGKGRPQA